MRMRAVFLLAGVIVLRFPLGVLDAAGQPATVVQGQALTFRVAGSSIFDATGVNIGNVEALSIDPVSGRVMFAMVSLGFPGNRTTVTPIPWQLIQYRSDARQAGGIPGTFQQLTVPYSQAMLRGAPQFDSQAMARTADVSWMTTTYGYFASLAGGSNPTSGTQTGAGNPFTNPNAPGVLPSASPTNLFALPDAPSRFTNQPIQQATNPSGTLPAGALPPGTVPVDALPPGTIPAGELPRANPGTPRKVPLAPASPAAPAK